MYESLMFMYPTIQNCLSAGKSPISICNMRNSTTTTQLPKNKAVCNCSTNPLQLLR